MLTITTSTQHYLRNPHQCNDTRKIRVLGTTGKEGKDVVIWSPMSTQKIQKNKQINFKK